MQLRRFLLDLTAIFWLFPATAIAQCPAPLKAFKTIPNPIFAGWSVHPSDGVIRGVRSQWTVPDVQCDANPLTNYRPWRQSRAAVWIGIWGQKTDGGETTWLAQIGTVSLCGTGGVNHQNKAIAQLFHRPCPSPDDCPGSKPPYPGGYTSPGPTQLFDVYPGDTITAGITYYGRQPDNKLKYEASISKGNVLQPPNIVMLTDAGVSEVDAAWQVGLIVESEPDGDKPLFGPLRQPIGGLARFTTPITFTSFDINSIAPELWLETFPAYGQLFCWGMTVDEKALASTGLPDHYGQFSVTWQNWR